MTEAETRLLDEHRLLRRIKYVRATMHSWGLTTRDHGHIDVDDTAIWTACIRCT